MVAAGPVSDFGLSARKLRLKRKIVATRGGQRRLPYHPLGGLSRQWPRGSNGYSFATAGPKALLHLLSLSSVGRSMRVGVYIDGFNLYYGGKAWCGAGTRGWRWLDVRSLVASRLPALWPHATIGRVVYCTARVSGIDDPTSPRDQDRYLRALEVSHAVDKIEYGKFLAQVKTSPLATWTSKGRPQVTTSAWPIMVKGSDRTDVLDARCIASPRIAGLVPIGLQASTRTPT